MVDKNLSDLSDEELMQLYQASNSLAFEVLYRRHSGKIFQYLKNKVGADLAQELLQDTFARIHKSRDRYNAQFPFLPWVFTVTRNILFDHFKKAETQTRLQSEDSDFNDVIGTADLSNSEHLGQLEAALSLLPEQQKRAVELRYLSDWSFEKIAAEIDTTPQNVRQLVSRGVKKIRSSLAPKGDQ